MATGNYRVQVTLKESEPVEVNELINVLTEDIDLDVGDFVVEAFKQQPDESWVAIGLDEI